MDIRTGYSLETFSPVHTGLFLQGFTFAGATAGYNSSQSVLTIKPVQILANLVKPVLPDLRHAEQLLFLCPCSNLTVFKQKFRFLVV